jgi:hypothetical protein
VRRQARERRASIQNALRGEGDTFFEIKTGGDRLLAFDPHAGPSAEVSHHLEEAGHVRR